ncbi:MAG: hypothetical protein AAFX03_06865 [Pseudomonadota bacterium]
MEKLIFAGLAVFGLGYFAMSNGAGFDYENADDQARGEYLQSVGERFGGRNAIRIHEMARVKSVAPRVQARQLGIEIDLVLGFPNTAQHATTPEQRRATACRAYLGHHLAKHDIEVVVSYTVRGRVLEKTILTPAACERLTA